MAHFSGVVNTDEGPVEVKDGVAEAGGEIFFVSDDGRLVVNRKRQIVAIINNNKVQQLTPEIVDQLKQEGLVADTKAKE